MYASSTRRSTSSSTTRSATSRRSSTSATLLSGWRRSLLSSPWTASRTRRSWTAGSCGSSTATRRRDGYPYSTPIDLAEATTDTFTESTAAVNALPGNRVNYIRNSVKATVDAYDGTVTLYGWDEEDPVLQDLDQGVPGHGQAARTRSATRCWRTCATRRTCSRCSARCSTRYHVTDRRRLLQRQRLLDRAQRPEAAGGQRAEPPYYLTMPLPGRRTPTFSLTSTFVPGAGRTWRRSWPSTADAVGPDYGTDARPASCRGAPQINGPGQVQNTFESDAEVA